MDLRRNPQCDVTLTSFEGVVIKHVNLEPEIVKYMRRAWDEGATMNELDAIAKGEKPCLNPPK